MANATASAIRLSSKRNVKCFVGCHAGFVDRDT